MQVPEEFKRLTRCIWQGSDRDVANEVDWKPLSLSPKDMDFIEAKNSL